MDISNGYVIKSAANGGFIVTDRPNDTGRFADILGAFTTSVDLIAWLAKQHGVPFGGFDVSAEMIEVVKGALVGNGALGDACIEWNGGECPVNPSTLVSVKFRHGGIRECKLAKIWSWDHRSADDQNNHGDIVAYRVI